MNKSEFIKKLVDETGYDEAKCSLVNDIFESHFIVGKKGKERITSDFVEQLGLSQEEAETLYEKSINILGSGLKNKLRHPFKSKD